MATEAYAERVTHRRRPAEYVTPVLGLIARRAPPRLARGQPRPGAGAVLPRVPDRDHERRAVCPRRARLHARLRHPRADQLRTRRRLHARRDDRRVVDRHGRLSLHSRLRSRPWGTSGATLGALVPAILVCLAVSILVCGLLNASIERIAYKPLAQRASARAADHRHRHVVHPPERRDRLEGHGDRLGRTRRCRRGRCSRSAT